MVLEASRFKANPALPHLLFAVIPGRTHNQSILDWEVERGCQ